MNLLVGLLLLAGYLVLRLPNLRAMPVFTDEATYARWAQLIAADPLRHAFVSVADAKPPLHYWLLALTRWLADDPILAGRRLSVLAGALSLPLLFPLAAELLRLARRDVAHARLLAGIAGVLMITSPLIALQQRMIMAESLLLLETVAAAWLSLRLARLVAGEVPLKRLLLPAAGLGLVWAAALLTKQVFSYFLWGFLPLAVLAHASRGSLSRLARRALLPVAVMALIGPALFFPAILTDSTQPLVARLLYKPVFLGTAAASRTDLIGRHIAELFLPRTAGTLHFWPHDPHLPLDDGILYLYFTPVTLAIVLAALAWMLRPRSEDRRLALFLGGWAAVFLAAFVAGAGVIMSRYAVLPATAMLLAAAWLLMDLALLLQRKASPGAARLAAVGLVSLVTAWPLGMSIASLRRWDAPVYTTADVKQYITEFGGGQVTEQAIALLDAAAEQQPITIITSSWVGTPNDALWLYFSGHPSVQIYWDDYLKHHFQPVAPGTYLLGKDRWADAADTPIALDRSRPTFCVLPVIHKRSGSVDFYVLPSDLPPHETVARLYNPTDRFDTADYLELVIVRLTP